MKIRSGGYQNVLAGGGAQPVSPLGGAREVAASTSARPAASAGDVSTFMGIPETELTPKVRSALTQLMGEVQTLRQELDRARRRIDYLEDLSDQDPMLPMLNRRAFVRELNKAMAFSERYDSTSSVVYFDVNHLKDINDQHGHAAGDAALLRVGDMLTRRVRSSDIVGRLGGDEFAVILLQADRENAQRKGVELVEAIKAAPITFNGATIEISVAYGVHSFGGQEGTDEALAEADKAMYENKMASRENK